MMRSKSRACAVAALARRVRYIVARSAGCRDVLAWLKESSKSLCVAREHIGGFARYSFLRLPKACVAVNLPARIFHQENPVTHAKIIKFLACDLSCKFKLSAIDAL